MKRTKLFGSPCRRNLQPRYLAAVHVMLAGGDGNMRGRETWMDRWRREFDERTTRSNYEASVSYWRYAGILRSPSGGMDSTDMMLEDVRLTSHDIAVAEPGFPGFPEDETGSWLGTDGRAAHVTTRRKLEEASSHTSATTHAGTVFVARGHDLWPIDPKINGLIVKHLCVGFWDIMRKIKHTDTTVAKTLYFATAVGVGKDVRQNAHAGAASTFAVVRLKCCKRSLSLGVVNAFAPLTTTPM